MEKFVGDNNSQINSNNPNEKGLGKKLVKVKFPKELIPTQKTMFVFEVLFILVLILGFTHIPMDSLFSGNLNFEINIGWPVPFFQLNMDAEEVPDNISIIRWGGLIIDSIVYLLIGYIIDVMINISWSKVFEKEEVKKHKKKQVQDKTPKKSALHSLYLTFFPEKEEKKITEKDIL